MKRVKIIILSVSIIACLIMLLGLAGCTLDANGNPVTTTGSFVAIPYTWQGGISGLASPPANPQITWAYYNNVDNISYWYDGTNWNILCAGTGLSTTLTSGNLFVGSALNVATSVAMSGDVSLTNTGATTVLGLKGVALPALATGYLTYNSGTGLWSFAAGGGISSIGATTPTSLTGILTGNGSTVGSITNNSTAWNAAQAGSAILTALSGLTYVSGSPHITMTGASSFGLDTTTYQTHSSALDAVSAGTWAGDSSITTLGTVTTGTFSGITMQGTISSGTGLTFGNFSAGTITGALSGNATTATSAGSVTGLSVTAGKTLTVSNSLTLSGTDGSTLAIGTGGTLGTAAYTASSAYSPVAGSSSITTVGTVTTGTLSGVTIQGSISSGTGLTFGNFSAGTITGALSGNATTATSAGSVTGLSVTVGKTLTVSNSLTLSGTDGSTLAIGTGGTLGTAAYTASSAYSPVAGSSSIYGRYGYYRNSIGSHDSRFNQFWNWTYFRKLLSRNDYRRIIRERHYCDKCGFGYGIISNGSKDFNRKQFHDLDCYRRFDFSNRYWWNIRYSRLYSIVSLFTCCWF